MNMVETDLLRVLSTSLGEAMRRQALGEHLDGCASPSTVKSPGRGARPSWSSGILFVYKPSVSGTMYCGQTKSQSSPEERAP